MTTKKKAAAPKANKAMISESELASFMGMKDSKGLKPYCETAKNVCNAFAEGELMEGHNATMALLHCAVWLRTAKVKTVEKMRELPLTVRYMVILAKEEQSAA